MEAVNAFNTWRNHTHNQKPKKPGSGEADKSSFMAAERLGMQARQYDLRLQQWQEANKGLTAVSG